MGYKKELFSFEIRGSIMKKTVIVRGPAFSRSGYGEHVRYLLRSLRKYPERFDIYLLAVGWGATGTIVQKNEEFEWFQSLTHKFNHVRSNYVFRGFDISLQVTIPGEFDSRMAKYNIGVTAGVETTKISAEWIQKINTMDKVITISDFSKQGIVESMYDARLPNGEVVKNALKVEKPIEIIHYPVRKTEAKIPDIDFETEFNFFVMAQFGARKNLVQTIVGFVEQFWFDARVGMVLKINKMNNSTRDFYTVKQMVTNILEGARQDRRCKIYLLHGEMSDEETQGLYLHPKIKAFVNIAHGEGAGLPILDAVVNGLPVIATNWSGHLDFLCKPKTIRRKQKNGKVRKLTKKEPMFTPVDYELKKVQQEVHWKDIIIPESMWAFPKMTEYRRAMIEVIAEYDKKLEVSKELKKWVEHEFEEQKMFEKFANAIYSQTEEEKEWEEKMDKIETF